MSTAPFPDFSSPIINGIHEEGEHRVGKGFFGIIWASLTGGKIRNGDYYFSRTRTMIKQHYPGLPLQDQNTVHFEVTKVIGAQEKLECAQGVIEKHIRARKYERVSKETFKIVKRVSNRADTNNVMAQMSEIPGGRPPQPPPTGTTSTFTNPFADSHAVSSLSDIDVSNVSQVEMTTYESEPTGETAVIYDLHGRDASTQQVVATFSPEIIVANEIEPVSQAASIHDNQVYDSHSEAGDDDGR
ncbi:hypothetical protein EI94DRAFT_1761230 [Lactarius quietus]|nr:hypothetical protein EI94DRAFT_1761230 [Lactarius quietus]